MRLWPGVYVCVFALRRRRWLGVLLLRCGAGEALLAICAAGARLAWEGEERGEAKEAVETGGRGG